MVRTQAWERRWLQGARWASREGRHAMVRPWMKGNTRVEGHTVGCRVLGVRARVRVLSREARSARGES